jgi:hypothetical protein
LKGHDRVPASAARGDGYDRASIPHREFASRDDPIDGDVGMGGHFTPRGR